MRNRLIKVSGSIATVIFLLVGYNHCVAQKKTNKSNDSVVEKDYSTNTPSSNGVTILETSDDPVTENPNIIVSQTVEIGVKNYEQILHTMSSLTGVSIDDQNIVNVYNQVKDQLPTSNDIKSFQSSHQVSIVKLASEFCHELVESGTLRDKIWPNFNFNASPSSELDTQGRSYIIESVVDSFWMLSDQEYAIKFNALSELNSLINDLLIGESQSSPVVTREIVKGVCISTLSSIHAVML